MSVAAASPSDLFAADDWRALLDVSLTGINLVRPVYGPQEAGIVDFAIEYLNPAAQRMTDLAEQPGGTLLGRFPHAAVAGIFQYYRRVFETGETLTYETNYQADGLDNYFQFQARRSGAHLVVSFTDTSDHDRSAVELALRESQARERAAHAEAEAQRQQLHDILLELPAQVAINRGPAHVFDFVNPRYQQLFPGRSLQGQPVRLALPELVGQPYYEQLDRVYQTGESFYGPALPAPVFVAETGQIETRYYDVFFQALRDGQGQIDSVLNFAYDVTGQVQAHRQVEQLNQQLEALVAERTRELQAARAATERARWQWEELFRRAPAAICIFDGPEWVYEFANPGYQAMFPGQELLGKRLLDVFPELAGQALPAILRRVYDTGEPFEGKEVLVPLARTAGGPVEDIYFDLTYLARYNETGQIDGFITYAYDVTPQVRARQQVEQLNQELERRVQERTHQVREAQTILERERALLQALLTQAPVAIALFQGEELRVTAANELMAAIWGYSPAQVLGRPLVEGVPELQGQGFDDLLRQVLHTRVPVTGTEAPATMRRNGQLQTTYYNFVYQPLYNAEGEVLGVIDVAVEVTEQVEARRHVEQLNQELEARVRERTQELAAAQAATERQRRRLSEVFEQAPVAICVFAGPDYALEVVNPPMGEMLGQPAAQLMGLPFFEALPELKEQGLRELLDWVRQTGTPYYAQEQEIHLARHGVGGSGYYDFTYQPLQDAQGHISAVTCVATDVTEQVRARQQVQNLNQELAAINEELTATNEELHQSNTSLLRTNHDLDTFVYTASHDLKAPITNIEGILNALRETLPGEVQQDEVVAHILGLLDHTVERFLITIDQLTDLTRLQQTYNAPAERLPLAPVVAGVLVDLAPQVVAAAAQVQVEVPAELHVSFAPASLRSIVYNLLSNAIKYRAPERPAHIWLRAEVQPAQVVLTVQDNGLGLTASQQQRLFGVFQRLHTHVEGTGVGLYMIKRLIENAGATITVTSTLGVGSTFTVTFPTK